ncbi:hypothetical protein [Helicobacter felis]|nr:hypothetical protein [Helicobacter felis]
MSNLVRYTQDHRALNALKDESLSIEDLEKRSKELDEVKRMREGGEGELF